MKPLRKLAGTTLRSYWKYRIQSVLKSDKAPDTSRAEKDFQRLMDNPKRINLGNYGYTPRDTWDRAVRRVDNLLTRLNLEEPSKRILEACCGDGSVGAVMSAYGHDVTLTDMDDWRNERSKSLPFCKGMLEDGLQMEDGAVDAAFSYNAFEHVSDPMLSLKELARVVRVGGAIYLSFGPLYASPWGMHAYRTLPMPFPQYLFSENFLEQKIKDMGVWDLGGSKDDLQPMNRWTVSQFENLWQTTNGLKVEYLHWHTSERRALPWVMRYPECFCGRGLTWRDIGFSACSVMLRRTSEETNANATTS